MDAARGPLEHDTGGTLALERLPPAQVLLQLFRARIPSGGSGAGRNPGLRLVTQLLGAGRLAGLAVYGSPYLLATVCKPLLPGRFSRGLYSPGQILSPRPLLLERLGYWAQAASRRVSPTRAAKGHWGAGTGACFEVCS